MKKRIIVWVQQMLFLAIPILGHASQAPWTFKKDVNQDDAITISDVLGWLSWLFFLPGNSLIYVTVNYLPELAQFFELTLKDYNGFFSGIISVVLWILTFVIVGALLEALE